MKHPTIANLTITRDFDTSVMNKKRIYSFVPYHWSPHLETDLELINHHLTAGDDVTVYICEGELPACAANPAHELDVCKHCISKRRNTLNVNSVVDLIKIQNFVRLKESDKITLKDFKNLRVESVAELREICLESCAIGNSIYSELMTSKKEIEPDIQENADYISRSIEAAALTYLSFKNIFAEAPPDIFYTFNGRMVVNQAAVAAAKAARVTYAVHDRAGTLNKYVVVENNSLHSLSYWKKQIEVAWQSAPEPIEEREAIAKKWFDSRLRNENQGWFSFTAEQNVELPPSFDKSKINIAIFNSSDFEQKAFEDYNLPYYKDQNDGILQIVHALQAHPDFHIYLRVHPHLKGLVNSQTEFVNEHLTNKFSNLTVIDADSKIKSYGLLMNSDAVVTFGSTIGVEAAWHGVPSILAGHSWYEDLSATFTPRSHIELIELIESKAFKLSDADKQQKHLNAAKYAYFQQTNGTYFSLFEHSDVMNIAVKTTGSPVAYDPVPYVQGLQRELKSRVELIQTDHVQPLTRLINELKEVCDKQAEKNAGLKNHVEGLLAEVDRVNQLAKNEQSLLQLELQKLRAHIAELQAGIPKSENTVEEPAIKPSLQQAARDKISKWIGMP